MRRMLTRHRAFNERLKKSGGMMPTAQQPTYTETLLHRARQIETRPAPLFPMGMPKAHVTGKQRAQRQQRGVEETTRQGAGWRRARRRFRTRSIFTSPLGVAGQASVARRVLLGH